MALYFIVGLGSSRFRRRAKWGHRGMMRWLLTYADLITLLLALFIILYAISATKSTVVLQEMMAQFRAVFGPIPGNTTILPSQSSNPGEHYKIIPGEPQEGGPAGPAPRAWSSW